MTNRPAREVAGLIVCLTTFFSVNEIVFVCGFYLKGFFFKDRRCFHVVKDICLIFQLNGYIYFYLVFESERGMG